MVSRKTPCPALSRLKVFGQVNYIIIGVLWSLILVESTDGITQPPPNSKKREDEPGTPFAEETKMRHLAESQRQGSHKPLTASTRQTFRYLYYMAGVTAPFRAVHVYLVYLGVETVLSWLAKRTLGDVEARSALTSAVIAVAIGAVTSPLAVWWDQAVISRSVHASASRRWPRSLAALFSLPGLMALVRQLRWPRFPSSALIREGAPPTILAVALRQLFRFRPETLPFRRYVFGPLVQQRAARGLFGVALTCGVIVERVLVDAALFACRHTPLLAMRRVHASLLAEDADAIVLLDRALRGGTDAKAVWGRRPVSLWEAWRTMSGATIWRLVKVKTIAAMLSTVWDTVCWTMIPPLFGISATPKFGSGSPPS